MYKISIIGKGTAGILSANHFASYTKDDEVEIECYYDSSIQEQTVGEGTTVDVPLMLNQTQGLEFHDIFNLLNGNFKTGIHYLGWGKQDFMHTFPMPNASIHFNAVMLQNYLKDKLSDRVKFIDSNVHWTELNSDYVIDCSGKPNDMNNYYKAKSIPVNAALVYQCSWLKPEYTHTLCIAHKYGWIFGIPLQDRISFGYMYNTEFNNKKEIDKELQLVIEQYGYSVNDFPLELEFNNYFKKENYTENVAFNGNASFFLEPMEATSIATIDEINRHTYDVMFNGYNPNVANRIYREWFQRVQDIIVLHYLAGSQYDTKFWKHAVSLAENNFSNRSTNLNIIMDNVIEDKEVFGVTNYGTWTLDSFKQNIKGLGITKEMLSI